MPTYTLVQVSINDLIMLVAFAPLVGLLLGVTDVFVPWDTLLLSVVLYVVIPLVASYLTRKALTRAATRHGRAVPATLQPPDPGASGDRSPPLRVPGRTIVDQPLRDPADRLPFLVRATASFSLAMPGPTVGIPFTTRHPRPYRHLELLRAGGGRGDQPPGLKSGAALATVVGVLVEVPVMLSFVAMPTEPNPGSPRKLSVPSCQQAELGTLQVFAKFPLRTQAINNRLAVRLSRSGQRLRGQRGVRGRQRGHHPELQADLGQYPQACRRTGQHPAPVVQVEELEDRLRARAAVG